MDASERSKLWMWGCAVALAAVLAPAARAQVAPKPPQANEMAPWMAGTVLCIEVVGKNSDGTVVPKYPQGSGFVVNRHGYVITNSHVVRPHVVPYSGYALFEPSAFRGTFEGSCSFEGTASYKLELVAFDDQMDLALLKIQQNVLAGRNQWRFIPRGDSNAIAQGQRLIVLGYPKGDLTFNPDGSVNAMDASRGRVRFSNPVDRGASGGPVLDERGYVVGVVWGGEPSNPNVNFFIPINFATGLLRIAGSEN